MRAVLNVEIEKCVSLNEVHPDETRLEKARMPSCTLSLRIFAVKLARSNRRCIRRSKSNERMDTRMGEGRGGACTCIHGCVILAACARTNRRTRIPRALETLEFLQRPTHTYNHACVIHKSAVVYESNNASYCIYTSLYRNFIYAFICYTYNCIEFMYSHIRDFCHSTLNFRTSDSISNEISDISIFICITIESIRQRYCKGYISVVRSRISCVRVSFPRKLPLPSRASGVGKV